jgi:hypothetical protein
LGFVAYQAQTVLENGISNYWKLKAIDSIEEERDFGEITVVTQFGLVAAAGLSVVAWTRFRRKIR